MSRNDEWKTVLSLAAQLNRMHTIAVLIEHNADINAQDRDKVLYDVSFKWHAYLFFVYRSIAFVVFE